MEDTLKIALGVFIGALAAAFTWEGIQTIRVEIALKHASDEIRKANEQAQARSRAQQATAMAEQNRQAQEAEDAQRKAIEAADLAKLREKDRAEAFKRFYQPTASCATDPNQMACANAFMKATTVFNSQYQPKR
jgi:uncharacterized membrane protein YhiD involved in acid resistance